MRCSRCELDKPALAEPPLPGKWGRTVVEQTCADCWHEWFEEQTRLINHEGLRPSEAEHRQLLYERMSAFLRLTT